MISSPRFLGEFGVHQQTGRRPVRQLARIARRDEFARTLHRLEAGQPFKRGIRPIAFVAINADFFKAFFAGFFVDFFHFDIDRGDFIVKLAALLSGLRIGAGFRGSIRLELRG